MWISLEEKREELCILMEPKNPTSVGKASAPINMWIESVTIFQMDAMHSDKQHTI